MPTRDFQEDRISKARSRSSFVGATITVILALYLIGILGFVVYFSNNFITSLSQKIEMEFTFFSEVPESEIIQLEKELQKAPFAGSTQFHSKDANTQEAIEVIGTDFTQIIANPINATLTINVKPEFTAPETLDSLAAALKSNTIIQDITYPRIIAESFHKKLFPIQLIILSVALILIFVAFILVINSIRLAIYSKRFLIKSMLLVGATRGFVRKPFLKRGLLQGFLGGFWAVVLLSGTLYAGYIVYQEYDLQDFIIINPEIYREIGIIFGGVFGLSFILTLFATLISVNKYIRIKTDNLF